MKRPIHETVRRIGQLSLCVAVGLGVGALAGIAITCMGVAGFICVAAATGASLITLANSLKRREQRASMKGVRHG